MTKSRNDFIVDNMISSMESNWVTDFGSLQRLGEEITHSHILLKKFVSEELHMLNYLDSDNQASE